MKKWFAVLLVLVLSTLAFTVSSEAGDRSRHRWQGIAIGAASFMVLDHIFNHAGGPVQTVYAAPPPVVYEYRYYDNGPRHFCPPGHAKRPYYREERWAPEGHWESVWIPGYYDSCGRYVDGHYERFYVADGYGR